MNPSMMLAVGDAIGTVDNAAHVHLQKSSVLIHNLSPLPMSWEEDCFDTNHMIGITPLLESSIRNIDNIVLYRDIVINNTNPSTPVNPVNITVNNQLYGKIDVLLDAEDFGIMANGTAFTGLGGSRLAHRMAYFEIFDNASVLQYRSEEISFDAVPTNDSAPDCFHQTLAQDNNWAFFLTHYIANMPYNRYWNSRQIRPSVNGAPNQLPSTYDDFTDVPKNAAYPDGSRIYFQGTVEDYGGNSDTRTLPISTGTATVPTTFYTLDNFWPYISAISVSQDGNDFATLHRFSSEGLLTIENDGVLLNNCSVGDSFDKVQNSSIAFTVSFSEPMENVDFEVLNEMTLNGAILPVSGTDNKDWIGNFTMDIGIAKEIQIEFTGNDRAGNDLIDLHAITNSNSHGISVLIPTRTDVTTSNSLGWNNYPTAFGSDAIDLKFGCFSQSITDNIDNFDRSQNNNSNCQFILNPSFNINHATCNSKGSIAINNESSGVPFEVLEFFDESGDIRSSGKSIVKNLDPGIYHYDIQFGCCRAQGSIEIFGPELPDYTATFSEGVGPAGGVDITLIVDIPEQLGQVQMVLRNVNTGVPVCSEFLAPGEITTKECFGLSGGDEYCLEFMWGENCSLTECLIAPGNSCPDDLYVVEAIVNPACANVDNGSITLDIESGNCSSLFIQWSNGLTVGSLEGLSSGTYCVTISAECNSEDCESISCYEVEELLSTSSECLCPPILIESSTDDICVVPTNPILDNNGNIVYIGSTVQNGIINIEVTQGGGSYTYTWDDGGSSEAYREVRSAGTYCVTIKDACKTSFVQCFEISKLNSPGGFCFRQNFVTKSESQSGFIEITNNWNNLPQTVNINNSYDVELESSSTNQAVYSFREDGLDESRGVLFIEKAQNQSKIVNDFEVAEVPQQSIDDQVKIYPNPFVDYFYIEFDSKEIRDVKIRIYNLSGQLAKETNTINLNEGKNEILVQNISHLVDGLYIVQLTSGTWIQNIQIVKMNN